MLDHTVAKPPSVPKTIKSRSNFNVSNSFIKQVVHHEQKYSKVKFLGSSKEAPKNPRLPVGTKGLNSSYSSTRNNLPPQVSYKS
jgi:hypothetical protein